MTPNARSPWIVFSERLYGALLVLYPVAYRREYGSLMRQVFRDVARDRYREQGWAGMLVWWCTTLLDLAITVIEQRRKGGFAMSKATFVRLTGSLLALGGAFCGLAAFSQLQPGDHYSYYGIYQLVMWLFAPGCLLLGLGIIGLAMRYEAALGRAGRWLLTLCGVGALGMAVGVVATSLNDDLWNVWFATAVLHVVTLTLFGLLHVRQPTLPVFRALPLQIAAGWLIMMLGVLRTNSETFNNALSFLLFLGVGLAWLAIGLAVNRVERSAALAAA
ncbi:MAG: hypothetical protein IT320_19525 [Anaerolineae bacterium]|nr:hypothetical protein [Anaerolineae bacterium]